MNDNHPGSTRARGGQWKDHVTRALRTAPGLELLHEITPVAGGRSHLSWRVHCELGDILVKMPIRTPDWEYVNRHVVMHLHAQQAGVAVPPLLRVLQTPAGFPLLVFGWIHGRDGQQRWPELTPLQQQQVAHKWGREVARAHQITGDAFTGHAPGVPWEQVVAAELNAILMAHRTTEILPTTVMAAAVDQIRRTVVGLGEIVRPAWTHRDLHLANIVVTETGGFAGLLDCEHARWWDPVADAIKLGMWVGEHHPETEKAFWAGYFSFSLPLHQIRRRRRVCAGLEWLSGLAYWHRVGDYAMLENYRSRLISWLGHTIAS
ncbi:MAG: aminoglycoside phosphotransferase family protein [Mycobacterium sp.]|nr:aminoglycoside phosphotransferase family protein [Mycobacterium sp.]